MKGARERLQARGLSERASVPSLRLALAAEAAAEAAAAAAPVPSSPAIRMCASQPSPPLHKQLPHLPVCIAYNMPLLISELYLACMQVGLMYADAKAIDKDSF